jgi:hypothetical protein
MTGWFSKPPFRAAFSLRRRLKNAAHHFPINYAVVDPFGRRGAGCQRFRTVAHLITGFRE